MMNVALRLDGFLHGSAPPTPAQAARIAATAALAGVDSLAVLLPATDASGWKVPLERIREVFDGPVLVICPLLDDPLRLVHDIRPELTVFTGDGFLPLDRDDLAGPVARDAVQAMRTSRAPFVVHVPAIVSLIKAARQLEAEGVLLPAAPLLYADDTAQAVAAMEELETGALAASKLGLRVFLDGELDRASWGALSRLDLFEGAVVGSSLIDRALLLGLGPAMTELRMLNLH
ncbi:pyridoxine 5'-phosphate synthase [bacterium]|nr:pyridoxine 5'-phosphate synthase [bacterium]